MINFGLGYIFTNKIRFNCSPFIKFKFIKLIKQTAKFNHYFPLMEINTVFFLIYKTTNRFIFNLIFNNICWFVP